MLLLLLVGHTLRLLWRWWWWWLWRLTLTSNYHLILFGRVRLLLVYFHVDIGDNVAVRIITADTHITRRWRGRRGRRGCVRAMLLLVMKNFLSNHALHRCTNSSKHLCRCCHAVVLEVHHLIITRVCRFTLHQTCLRLWLGRRDDLSHVEWTFFSLEQKSSWRRCRRSTIWHCCCKLLLVSSQHCCTHATNFRLIGFDTWPHELPGRASSFGRGTKFVHKYDTVVHDTENEQKHDQIRDNFATNFVLGDNSTLKNVIWIKHDTSQHNDTCSHQQSALDHVVVERGEGMFGHKLFLLVNLQAHAVHELVVRLAINTDKQLRTLKLLDFSENCLLCLFTNNLCFLQHAHERIVVDVIWKCQEDDEQCNGHLESWIIAKVYSKKDEEELFANNNQSPPVLVRLVRKVHFTKHFTCSIIFVGCWIFTTSVCTKHLIFHNFALSSFEYN